MRDPTVTDCPDGCDCPESDKMHRIRLLEKRLAAAEADRERLVGALRKIVMMTDGFKPWTLEDKVCRVARAALAQEWSDRG